MCGLTVRYCLFFFHASVHDCMRGGVVWRGYRRSVADGAADAWRSVASGRSDSSSSGRRQQLLLDPSWDGRPRRRILLAACQQVHRPRPIVRRRAAQNSQTGPRARAIIHSTARLSYNPFIAWPEATHQPETRLEHKLAIGRRPAWTWAAVRILNANKSPSLRRRGGGFSIVPPSVDVDLLGISIPASVV